MGSPIPVAGSHNQVVDVQIDESSFVAISADGMLTTATQNTIETHGFCPAGEQLVLGADSFTNYLDDPLPNAYKYTFDCYFMKLTTDIMAINDKAYKIGQVYRALTDKYGDKLYSRYINTNTYVSIDTTAVEVFGGDTYTYGSFLRNR